MAAMQPPPFAAGDVVALKSGGTAMTVRSVRWHEPKSASPDIDGWYVRCDFFDRRGNAASAEFPSTSLIASGPNVDED